MEQLKRNQILGNSAEQEPLMKSSGEAKPRIPACVYIFTFFAAIGGFEMGYNFSVVSGAQAPQIHVSRESKRFFHEL